MWRGKLKQQNQRILDAIYRNTPEEYQVHSGVATTNFAAFEVNTDPSSPELSDIEFAWCVKREEDTAECLIEGEKLFNSLAPVFQEWFMDAIYELRNDVDGFGVRTIVSVDRHSHFVVVTPGDCQARVYYLAKTNIAFAKPTTPEKHLDYVLGEVEDAFLRETDETEKMKFAEYLDEVVYDWLNNDVNH